MATVWDTTVLQSIKHRPKLAARKRAALDAAMQETLRRTGYTALKKSGRKSQRPDFPDLTVDHDVAPCGNGFGKTTPVKELPPDAHKFPVGHSHKQGLEAITPGTDLKWMGGKKT